MCLEEIPLQDHIAKNSFLLGRLMQNCTWRDRIKIEIIPAGTHMQIRRRYSEWEKIKKELV